MEKLISVVVCTYNQEDTIARTLESVLRQKCSWPLEIIIGEDHSSDGTLNICRKYAQKFPETIRLMARKENIGLVDNYFGCLLEAKGKYIADIAGDDEWCDDLKLEKEIYVLENNSDVVLVHTDYQLRVEETGEIIPAIPYWFNKGISSGKDLTLANFRQLERPLAHLCTSLYRNETFRECYAQYPEFFKGNKYPCEDLQLTTLLSTKGSFAYLDEVTLNYSINRNSISNILSYEKQWHFVEGAARLRYDLASTLSLGDNKDIKANLVYQVYVLMMHSFRVHSKDLRQQTILRARQWDVEMDTRTKWIKFFTSIEPLWQLSLVVRSLVVKLKRLLFN